MPDELALVVDDPSPRTLWALDHVFRSAGYRMRRARRDEVSDRPHLAYGGDGPAGPRGVWIAHDPGEVAWTALLDGGVSPETNGPRIEHDLVHAIGELLTDEVNAGATGDDLDEHGRLRHRAAWAARSGVGDRPVADRYVDFIGRVVEAVSGLRGLPRWPDGRRACIALSHDVDEPDRYALLRQATRPWRLRRAPRTLATRAAHLARRRWTDADRDAYWAFPELTALESRHGFRSTFFFAVTPFHADDGGLEDVHYDADGPRYRRAMATLRDGGFGIGLHAGYRAFERPDRFVEERRQLEELAGTEVLGLRHHYWHLGPDVASTLRAHESAGFRYDTSIAFNDHVGFRRGGGLPYRPFDAGAQRALTMWQLPPACMDGNLFYGSDDVEAAVRTVEGLIDEIVAVGGFGAFDWHSQASIPRSIEFRHWGLAYGEILDLLAARTDLWVTSLEEVLAWIDKRNAQFEATA